jgi:hypothetical protein
MTHPVSAGNSSMGAIAVCLLTEGHIDHPLRNQCYNNINMKVYQFGRFDDLSTNRMVNPAPQSGAGR